MPLSASPSAPIIPARSAANPPGATCAAPTLFDAAARCLAETDLARKLALTEQAQADWLAGRLGLDALQAGAIEDTPGRPERIELVAPRRLAQRKLTSVEGRAALVHAVAHIEFNAINLAWDAVQRFRGLPPGYYADWVRVAAEEARHFAMMRERLQELGQDYGDFPAHNGLWEMAERTAHDPLARMALVPRVLEARGLDVTPGMIERLVQAGDRRTAANLEVILREEVGHVAAGSRWFRHLCSARGLHPGETFFELLNRHLTGAVRGPLNLSDRRRAGFEADELERLIALTEPP